MGLVYLNNIYINISVILVKYSACQNIGTRKLIKLISKHYLDDYDIIVKLP